MKTTFCKCGNRLYFNNHSCLVCGRLVGHCQACNKLTSVSSVDTARSADAPSSSPIKSSSSPGKLGSGTPAPLPVTHYICDQPGCGREVAACSNRALAACTSFVDASGSSLCEWCSFTTLIPDLSFLPNANRWTLLEAAKRRVLAELQQLGLPPYVKNLRQRFPLSFEFPAPVTVGGVKQAVITGHAEGVVTINAEEADSDRREATRVALGEPQRTLIGHMRHEVGHYIDLSFASRVALDEYIRLFGDPLAVDYEQAKQRHYAHGAPAHWPERFVSAYATMHPWEDFAETVNAYLDLMAIAETARDQKLADINSSPNESLPRIVQQVLPVAVAISEFNSDLGLQPLLPERLSTPTLDKLCYVHYLRSDKLRNAYEQWLSSTDSNSTGGSDATRQSQSLNREKLKSSR